MTADYILQREPSTAGGTRGELLHNGGRLCHTLELPWKDNRRRISCIPAGTYLVAKRSSPKYGHHWEVNGVEGRGTILFHIGNTINDILGCILVGDRRGVLNGLPAVLGSKSAMDRLRAILPDSFLLEIRNA